ncbi:MAG: sugar transferase, partial [candidate division WOR-3 bacterium]
MGRFKSLVTGAVLIVGDSLAVATSYLVAYALRNYILAGIFNLLPEPLPFTPVVERAYLLAVYILVFAYEGLYTKRLAGWEATRRCLRGLIVATVAVMVILFAVRYHTMSRMMVALAFASGAVIVPSLRALLRALLVTTGFLRRPVLLVGSGETARLFLQELKRNRSLGYVPVGQFQQPPDDRTVDEIIKREQAIASSVALVVFADSFGPEAMKQIYRYAERRFAEVLIVPDPAFLQSQSVETEQVGNLLLMKYRYNLLRPANICIKRVFELVLCIFLIILSLPLFVIIAVMVKLSSPGPVFFQQQRIGRDGRLFECLKF